MGQHRVDRTHIHIKLCLKKDARLATGMEDASDCAIMGREENSIGVFRGPVCPC